MSISIIRAECHSDDRTVEAGFNAIPWALEATPKALSQVLVTCQGYGNEASDEVAMFMANIDDDVKNMFDHIDIVNESGGSYMGRLKRETCGFECSVEEDDLVQWLKENRPEVFQTKEMNTNSGSPLEHFDFEEDSSTEISM